ncbi:spore germination protein GerW family protein [Halococcoides cellulosivorans]|uniref:Sporulation protein n=1 Tax=Halococcoides cellulosivorans TaxID=1679096 RepID=A0A2R4X4C3_9EURY|nr:spore germination protein GerW family protein [Halococcoides cellulosivorans]AWB28651.1 hypothetical protein HARCEL1_05790 [Halococcoides cellulosivorans]
MDLPAEFQSLIDAIESSAADAVFGPPIERADRTVVPVARVGYGLGGGGGHDAEGEGGGLGGGVSARPAGALEVSDTGTRFVTATGRRRSLALVAVGIVLGVVLSRLLR